MKLIPLPGRGNEYLFTRPDSSKIHTRRYKEGYGEKYQALQTDSPVIARQRRDNLFIEWFGEDPEMKKKVKLHCSDHWSMWVKTKARFRKGTQDSIKYSGQHLCPIIDSMYPEKITEPWWDDTYIPLKRRERPARKFFNEWKTLLTFLRYLKRQGVIERVPLLINPDGPRTRGLFLEDSEIEALYEGANEDLALQVDLGFKHFMRRSEVLLMPFSEIDFKLGVIELPPERTKTGSRTGEGRTVPLNDAALAKLKARKAKNGSPFVFPSPKSKSRPIGRTGNQSAWEGALARANEKSQRINPDATFHDLRHSGLTRAFAATNKYAEICDMAGLSLAEAQKTYLHFKPEHTRFVADLVKIKSTEDSKKNRKGKKK